MLCSHSGLRLGPNGWRPRKLRTEGAQYLGLQANIQSHSCRSDPEMSSYEMKAVSCGAAGSDMFSHR